MARAQREKGKRAEREVADVFNAAGIGAKRTGWHQSHGLDVADVTIDVPGQWLEVKRQERIEIEAWCRQAEEVAGERVPVVVWRRSRQPWRVTLQLDDYIDLLRRAEAAGRES